MLDQDASKFVDRGLRWSSDSLLDLTHSKTEKIEIPPEQNSYDVVSSNWVKMCLCVFVVKCFRRTENKDDDVIVKLV